MSKKRSWTDQELKDAVAAAFSRRQVLIELGLAPRGGNYATVKLRILALQIDTSHFIEGAWNKGIPCTWNTRIPMEQLLVERSSYQSHKLKNRLFREGLKNPACEICGWAELSQDGRVPLELDHINGDHSDNRIENLRILCPNCHSLQPTHRGRNKKH